MTQTSPSTNDSPGHVSAESIGESALLLCFDGAASESTNRRVHEVAAAVRNANLSAVRDIVPAYASLLIRHRPLDERARNDLHRQIDALATATAKLPEFPESSLHVIPVCYGGGHGRDLASVARRHCLGTDEVIALHTAPEYQVAMIGFAPGFPYLLGLNPRLATPRHDTPRTRVPAGSVGLAGGQTGIYPSELPGGWQLIGQTPLTLFDPHDARRPCLLLPGDRVRFESIGAAQFSDLRRKSC